LGDIGGRTEIRQPTRGGRGKEIHSRGKEQKKKDFVVLS